MRALFSRLLALFRRGALDAQLDEEVGAHLARLAADFERQGMTPRNARFAARRSFGGVEQIKHQYRERRSLLWVQDIGRDVRLALRVLRRNPGFAVVAVLTLALGIGASTTLFTMIEATGVRELPVHAPGELVLIEWNSKPIPGREAALVAGVDIRPSPYGGRRRVFSYEAYREFRERTRLLSEVIAVAPAKALARVDGTSQGLSAELASGNYFSGLGVQVVRGRPIIEDDDRPGAEAVMVITHRYWVRRFDSDPAIVGKRVVLAVGPGPLTLDKALLDGVAATIVGVAAEGFHGVGGAGSVADAVLPLAPLVQGRGNSSAADPTHWWLHVFGRSMSTENRELIREELAVIFRSNAAATGTMLVLESGSRGVAAGKLLGRPLLLMAPAALVMLIACMNVSTLLLARSALRVREIGVRNAMGAGRHRLLRQLLTEHLVLAGLAGIVGVLFSVWGRDAAGVLLLRTTDVAVDAIELRTNALVLAFVVAVTLLTGMLCGLTPALRGSRTSVTALLAGQPSATGRSSRATRFAIVVQVAMSLMLLISGAALGRTLYDLLYVDPGFDTTHLIRVDGLGSLFNRTVDVDADQMALFRSDALERLGAMPGVETITAWRGSDVTNDGGAAVWSVQPNFFRVLSIPIVKGRELHRGDTANVAIINETMARRSFAGRDPIGEPVPGAPRIQIVGVAKNARVNGARRGRNTQSIEDVPAAYYVPDFADTEGPIDVAMRTPGDPAAIVPAILDTIRGVHPNLAPFVGTQDALMVRRAVGGGQFGNAAALGVALGAFAALSLLLVAIGLYGVTSYRTAARIGEFGVRLALGAAPRTIFVQVQREVLRLIAMGAIVGVATSIPIVLVFQRTIFRAVQPELLTPVLALLLMAGVAALSAYLPARRAARVQPLVALRNE